MRIETIVAPTDFSANAQNAFSVACELARLSGATLYAVHAAESPFRTAANENLQREGRSEEEIQKSVDELQKSRFAEMIAGCGPGIDVRCETIPGNPHVALLEFAKERKADLLVVGVQGQSALRAVRTALLGSVANTLLQNSTCPVVMVRATDHASGISGTASN